MHRHNDTLPMEIDEETRLRIDNLSYFYYSCWACIIAVGLIGNTGGVLIAACKPRVRRIAPIQWLLALGVVDNLMLLSLSIHVIEYMSEERVNFDWMITDAYCKVSTYVPYAVSTLSSWLIVGISVERALVVARPFSIHTVISVYRVRVVILVMTVGCCAITAWTLLTMVVVEQEYNGKTLTMCTSVPNFTTDYGAYVVMDIFASFVVPWILVLVSNVFTLSKVCKADKTRESLMKKITIVYQSKAKPTAPTYYRNGITLLIPTFEQSRRITISVNGIETELPTSAVLRRFRQKSESIKSTTSDRKVPILPPSRKRGSDTTSEKSTVTNRPSSEQQLQVQTQQHRKVLALLSKITILYLLLNVPNYGVRFLNVFVFPHGDWRPVIDTYEFQVVEKCSYLAYYSQFALNFLIYAPKYALKSVRNSRIGQRAIRQWSRYTRRRGGSRGSLRASHGAMRRNSRNGSNKGNNNSPHLNLLEQHSLVNPDLVPCPVYLPPSYSDDQFVRKRTTVELVEVHNSAGWLNVGGDDDMFAGGGVCPKVSTYGADMDTTRETRETRFVAEPLPTLSPLEQYTRRNDSYHLSVRMQTKSMQLSIVEPDNQAKECGGCSKMQTPLPTAAKKPPTMRYERKATNIQVANKLLAVTIEREWYNTQDAE